MYVLSPEMAVIAGLLENSLNSQPMPSSTIRIISSGLYSSHSPGRVRAGSGGRLNAGSTPQALASRALLGAGSGGVSDDQRDDYQRREQDAGLPEKDGFSERDHAGDCEDRAPNPR